MIRHAIGVGIFACGSTILLGWVTGETADVIAHNTIWFTVGAIFGATAPRMP
jgi:Na+-translocating ferredoxin:NAD+ oxidoreductase RnfG subunit